MEDVYFTKRDLDNSIDTGNAIDKLMRNPRCRILVNLDNDAVSKMTEDSSPDILFSYLQGHGKTFYSGKEMVTAIKETTDNKSNKLLVGFSRSIVMLSEKDVELAKNVENFYGIKCVLGKKGLQTLKDGKFFFFEEKEKGSWNDTMSKVTAMPCNAIIVNDHYVKTDNGINNLLEIIKKLSEQRSCGATLQILIIFSGSKSYFPKENHKHFYEKAERTANSIYDRFNHKMDVALEFIYCDDTIPEYKLYKYTHDRFAISNYTSVDASHALELFNENDKVETEQKVTVGNLLYDDTLKMNSSFIKRIANEVEKGIKNSESNPYRYVRYDIVKGELVKNECTDLSKIQNRFIVDELSIKEGESCYYLSVPNDNDWAGTNILPGFYTAVNYSKCIVARTKKELEEKKKKLQQLFINPSKNCEVPENDDDKYWRVIVTGQSNIKTVQALESKPGEKVCNQVNNYLNNCFKYEEDAWQRVAEIKDVLGLK